MRKIINRIACWFYFKTINESTLQGAMKRMRKTLVDRGDACASCKARKPLKGEKICGECFQQAANYFLGHIKETAEGYKFCPDEQLPGTRK